MNDTRTFVPSTPPLFKIDLDKNNGCTIDIAAGVSIPKATWERPPVKVRRNIEYMVENRLIANVVGDSLTGRMHKVEYYAKAESRNKLFFGDITLSRFFDDRLESTIKIRQRDLIEMAQMLTALNEEFDKIAEESRHHE